MHLLEAQLRLHLSNAFVTPLAEPNGAPTRYFAVAALADEAGVRRLENEDDDTSYQEKSIPLPIPVIPATDSD